MVAAAHLGGSIAGVIDLSGPASFVGMNARELAVSTTTVRKHLENIFQRLGVTSRTAATARAFPATPL